MNSIPSDNRSDTIWLNVFGDFTNEEQRLELFLFFLSADLLID